MDRPKLFVRQRNVAEGSKRPRFALVGSVGTDLRIKVHHVRKKEVEQIAEHIGAEVIYLEVDIHDDDDDDCDCDDHCHGE